jgi:HD-GYP domain-containing protein (c-di-GMP phosphodiesterase class II)
MDPETALSASRMHEDEVVDGIESLLLAYGIVIDEDMQFFIRQAYAIDERSHYWRGRCERVLKNCLELNENLGLELAQDQLAVAVLMHDVGMAFLPIDVLHKAGDLTAQEKALVSSHTQVGRQLISGMSRWQSAAEIIYQHHEHYNGKGYPQGLCADEICAGAKILSIADAFEACTHDRAYITRIKRPALRALLILNHGAGEQFDKKYVQSFAAMVEQSAKD